LPSASEEEAAGCQTARDSNKTESRLKQQGTATRLKVAIFKYQQERTNKGLQIILYVLFGIVCG
jgi:hypothetical protein